MIKKQRGTALIIAILLISAIGAVGFSFGRVFLAEFANARLHENSIVAFYSAESGIEEGFLRYRYSRNAEVPFADWSISATERIKFNLVNITTSTSPQPQDKTVAPATPGSNQYYYLRMGYAGTANKLPFFGQDRNLDGDLTVDDIQNIAYGDGDSSLTIIKDDSYKIDLSNVLSDTTKDINLYTKFIGDSSNLATAAKAFMQVKLVIDINGTGSTVKEYKTIISENPTSTCVLLHITEAVSCNDQIITANQITLSLQYSHAWNVDGLLAKWRARDGFPPVSPSSKVTLTLKPYNYAAKIGIVSTDCATSSDASCEYDAATVVPGPYTIVSSVGFYKNVYRTIEANIDRQSGSLYDLYDYVIYKAN